MKRDELDRKVAEELEHIPRGSRGSNQNYLRAAYSMTRRHDLAIDAATSRERSFLKALEAVRNSEAAFSPSYDKEFFRV